MIVYIKPEDVNALTDYNLEHLLRLVLNESAKRVMKLEENANAHNKIEQFLNRVSCSNLHLALLRHAILHDTLDIKLINEDILVGDKSLFGGKEDGM